MGCIAAIRWSSKSTCASCCATGGRLSRSFNSGGAWSLAAAKLKSPSAAYNQTEYEPAGNADNVRHEVCEFGGAAHERLNELNGCAEDQRGRDQLDQTSEAE